MLRLFQRVSILLQVAFSVGTLMHWPSSFLVCLFRSVISVKGNVTYLWFLSELLLYLFTRKPYIIFLSVCQATKEPSLLLLLFFGAETSHVCTVRWDELPPFEFQNALHPNDTDPHFPGKRCSVVQCLKKKKKNRKRYCLFKINDVNTIKSAACDHALTATPNPRQQKQT